jgi:P27 family predicted phage terminase small subunit
MPGGKPRDSQRLKILKNVHRSKDQLQAVTDATVDVLPTPPDPPEWLHPYARAEWAHTAPELHRKGWLGVVDETIFARYCQAYARWREAEEDINERGLVIIAQNKEKGQRWERANHSIADARRWGAEMEKCAARFGITADARRGWTVPKEKLTARERMLAKKNEPGA